MTPIASAGNMEASVATANLARLLVMRYERLVLDCVRRQRGCSTTPEDISITDSYPLLNNHLCAVWHEAALQSAGAA